MTGKQFWLAILVAAVVAVLMTVFVVLVAREWPKPLATPERFDSEASCGGIVLRVADNGVEVRLDSGKKTFVKGFTDVTNNQHVIVHGVGHYVRYYNAEPAALEWAERYVTSDK